MIVPPYYYTPTEDEIFRYYAAIADAVVAPDHALQQPGHVQRRHVGGARRPADARASRTSATSRRRAWTSAASTTSSRRPSGVMNVFAGERIVESFLLGAVGYVNPYGNYIPRAVVADLGPARRGPDRGRQAHPAADHPHRPRHRRGPSDLRPPVLLEGARRRRRPPGGRRARAADDLRRAGRRGSGTCRGDPAADARARGPRAGSTHVAEPEQQPPSPRDRLDVQQVPPGVALEPAPRHRDR